MVKSKDYWTWEEIGFQEWRNAVEHRLKDLYITTIDDVGIEDERLTSHWKMKQSPWEFVEWFGNKYDLDPKSAFGL
jgi:hypothetical protein